MSDSPTLSRQLTDLIRQKTVSEADLEHAAYFTLDAVANALAGCNTVPGQKLLRWGALQGDDAGRRAFVLGGVTHILETDDLHRESVTHPGCVVVPAVLALAEGQTVAGPDFLKAVLHGFEAMCRVGNAVGPRHYRIWHNTATCGPYGSAMAAATLENLSDEQAMHALGNAGTQSSGFWEFLETGAMSKHLHAGRAAESGITAAQLAALDFTGPPAILEGSRGFFAAACPDAAPQAVLADPRQPWALLQTSIKPWPCCRHTHPAIDAALALHRELAGSAIESVAIGTYQAALDVCDRARPANEYEAKFSLHHTVAAALEQGRIEFDSFDANQRSALEPLRSRTTVSASEPYVSAYPNSWGARVRVTTGAGATLEQEREGARGDPEFALDDREMIDKAKMLFDFAGFDPAAAGEITDSVLSLAAGRSGSDLSAALHERLRQAAANGRRDR